MRSALFWDFAQRRMVVLYSRVGITYRSHMPGSSSPRLHVLEDVTARFSQKVGKSTIPHSVKFRKNADLSGYKFLWKKRKISMRNILKILKIFNVSRVKIFPNCFNYV